MFWLVETKDQLKDFNSHQYQEVYIEIIPSNIKEHPMLNDICCVYIRPLSSLKGFILPVTHSETQKLEYSEILETIQEFQTLYVRDKKEFLHYIVHNNVIDISPNHSTLPEYTLTHRHFYNKYPHIENINSIVPIVKHYEYCEEIYNNLKDNISHPYNKFFNNKTSIVFNALEQSGIKINNKLFTEYFYKEENDLVYTQYNLKTLTSRPSNTFKGVNYAALNKENKSRECFIPRNDRFIEIDISAYHPSILAKLIDYDFKGADIHQYFANLYKVDYKRAKEITFQQLYGGVFDEYKNLEFFQKTQKYIDETWNTFNSQGFIECPISKHIFDKTKLKDMNPSKLLNYILQATETDLNVLILWDIFKLLRSNNTKLVLYTYDSFTFDAVDEEEEVMLNIQDIFKKHKLNIKQVSGTNYNNLK